MRPHLARRLQSGTLWLQGTEKGFVPCNHQCCFFGVKEPFGYLGCLGNFFLKRKHTTKWAKDSYK